jgi:long-chain acyl-CoA synthetase
MDRTWLRNYPAGVSPEIALDEYGSLNDVLACACERFRNKPAFRNLGATMT